MSRSSRSVDPHNWELLSASDQVIYKQLHQALSAQSNRDRRNRRVDDFKEILEAIELFENIDEEDRWKRCLVCGIFTFPGGVAVNIQQLKALIVRCKSSINGSLKGLGYARVASKLDGCDPLFETIPFLRTHGSELRKWTLRYFAERTTPRPPSGAASPEPYGVVEEVELNESDAWANVTEDLLL
jgi:hypothetical protein